MKSHNIPILSLALALSQSGPPIIVLLGGIVGVDLAPTPSLATLPIALLVVGVAIFVIPASLIMRRFGRKRGFMFSALLASSGATLAYSALQANSFVLFCAASVLVGLNGAFVQQYRFAAVESVEKEHAGRAVSFVLIGGIVAAFVGPEIAKRTQGLIGGNIYGAAFLVMAGLYLLVFLLLTQMQDVSLKENRTNNTGRPLSEIMRQKKFLIAVMAGAISYAGMTFVMTATPLQMSEVCGFPLTYTAGVIQSHIVAMYLPSLFTGFLIDRLGLFRVMAAGALTLIAAMIVGYFSGLDLAMYWSALVLLGLGWNLLFVGGTVLLTHTHTQEERFKTQATNDFVVFGTQATASFSAGTVLFLSGWQQITLIGFAAVTMAFVVLVLQRRELPARAASA